MDKKTTTSKKIAIFAGICFILSLLFVIISLIANKLYDSSVLITIITIAGSVFGVTCAFYYNKAKMENVYKIRKSFLREKYNLLNEMGILNYSKAQSEIEDEISKIDEGLSEEETIANQTIEYNG